jgi:hypothetical protein
LTNRADPGNRILVVSGRPADRQRRRGPEEAAEVGQVLTETGDVFPRADYRRLAEALRG